MPERSRMVALGNLLADISGVPFVWQYQSKKNPADVFISGRLVNVSQGRRDEIIYSEIDNSTPEKGALETHRSIDEYMLYLQGTGMGSNAILKGLRSRLRLPTYKTTLRGEEIGFAYITGTAVQDITEIRGGDFVERASVDLLMRTFETISEAIYNIEEVKFQ